MKNCPYCNVLIEDEYPYCPNCNKPLLSNLKTVANGRLRTRYDDSEFFLPQLDEEDENYEEIIIRDKQIERNIKEIDEILERKEILGDPIPGSLFLEKSSLYYKIRDLPNALKNLEFALKNFEDEDDVFNMAICHNEIGLIQEDIGFFDQAIYHFNRSLEILKDVSDNQRVIKVLNNLGNIYYLIKDLEHSYEYYQEALELSKQENLIFEEVKTSSNLVEVLYLLRDYDRVGRILSKNAEFFKQNDDIYGVISNEIKFGKLYFKQGEDFDLAYEYLNRAFDLIESLKDTTTIYIRSTLEWECLLYLGKLYLLWGNLSEAENCLINSLNAIRIFSINDNIFEGNVLESLAEMYTINESNEKAIEYYNLAYDIYYKYGDNKKCADIKFNIGSIILDSKLDKLNSIKYFEESLEMYEDLHYVKEAADTLLKLGDLYINRGITDIALVNLERARDYYKELQDEKMSKLINEKIKSLNNVNDVIDY
ncbi:MAG: tetratricopeptide repeat protein [Candidatus Lokiarchaeota archaeon]|nr:tetratricopeptide repeat protein [Candidatus Lokiarchaeota archaeon]